MLVVQNLMLKEGMIFEAVYFDGSSEELRETIEFGGLITFTFASTGRTKELNIACESIMCYETDGDVEENVGIKPDMLERAQIIMFPSAGFSTTIKPNEAMATEKLLHELFGKVLLNKSCKR